MSENWQDLLAAWEKKSDRAKRRAQGSFWTPESLAGLMAEWLGQINPARVLDPGAGSGNLLAPFEAILPEAELCGAEQDKDLRNVLKARLPGAEIVADFWQANDSFPAIVANPPYIRFDKIKNRGQIAAQVEKETGFQLPGRSNLAIFFFARCFSLLEDGGRMIFLVPTEFMQTKDGRQFKELLIKERLAEAIIELDDGGLFGDDVISTACLILTSKDKAPGELTFGHIGQDEKIKTLDQAIKAGKKVPFAKLDPEKRWMKNKATVSYEATIGDLVDVYPGHITGNNSFFIRSLDEWRALDLDQFTSYCLIRPQSFPDPLFLDQRTINRQNEQKRWLLTLPDEDKLTAPARALIAEGEAAGVNLRATQAGRDPWWRQDIGPGGLFTVANFRRGDYQLTAFSSGRGLLSKINFPVIPNLVAAKESREVAELLFAWLVTKPGQEALKSQERHAGNGLFTVRSGALKEVPCPAFQALDKSQREEILTLAKDLKDRAKRLEIIEALADLFAA